MARRLAGVIAAALLGAVGARALVFEPPYEGARVRVQRFETAGFPRVDMFFRVDSGHKQDFRYLHPANVRLFEEEVEIKDFDLQLESPALSIALVLDDSGSIDPELEYLKIAATRFVEELHRLDEVAVVSFHRRAELLQERTTAKQLAKEAIGQLRAYGATALYDGAVLGFDAVRQGRGEKKMLLLTDGNDQVYFGGRALSLENEHDMVRRARAEGVEIYTIALGHHPDLKMLERISTRTGGQLFYAPRPQHLREVFDAIARSLSATYRVRYDSPNARREKQDRTLTVDVNYQGHSGRGVGTYWIDKEIPVSPVTVEAERVAGNGPGMVRLFSRGLRGEFLQVDFTLYQELAAGKLGRIVRAGRTTRDGFGRLDRPDPLLVSVPPGRYTLELKIPDQEVRFRISGLEVVGGETTSRVVSFSRLVFTRDQKPWYDLQHPYGPTSELIQLTLADMLGQVFDAQGKGNPTTLFQGRLAQIEHHREIAIWLPEGVYQVTLDNLWKDEDPAETMGRGAPLANKLTARLQVMGGQELRFDVRKADLMVESDVLDPEWLAAHPDENPFLRQHPRTEKELEVAMDQMRDGYLKGRFTRHDRGQLGAENPYTYRNPDEVKARLAELSNRYQGPGAPPQDPPVDETYLGKHDMGSTLRRQRLDEIASHYLSEANPSFPDHAGASERYPGGPGDRYGEVRELRKRHDGLGSDALERGGQDPDDLLLDLRGRVANSSPPGEKAGATTPVVDPAEPDTTTSVKGLTARIRRRIRGEVYQHPKPKDLHNLDGPRR